MRLGIVTPVVNPNPRFDPPEWEWRGGMDDIVSVARAAEAAGYEFLGCSEHVFVPGKIAGRIGTRYWDPLATLSYVAASTARIGLLTHVLVLGFHHPLEVVKSYGTLDVASGGRVILGVGVGTLKPEFKVMGLSWEDRGARADDAIRAIRSAFGQKEPAYEGPYYSFGDLFVDPCGLPRHVPIWVGGNSRRSLRRAVELGDGWVPFGLELPALQALLADPVIAEARAGRAEPLDIVLAPEPPLDPIGDAERCRQVVRDYRDAGATVLSLRFVHDSRPHYEEQLAAMGALAAAEG